MALSIGNKKYRNLQEQVGFNTEQIEKIFEVLDGLNVQDNVVVISDLATPLTTEELEIVNNAVAFLIYSGELYIKKNESAGIAYFDIVFSVSGTTTISFSDKEIAVTLSNGALGQTTNTRSTYSATQIDSMVNAKADLSYVNTQLALKANLAGADFTGPITSPRITETMVGYSFTASGDDQGNVVAFAGAARTGNKLTLVIAGKITPLTSNFYSTYLGKFVVPSDVANKIVPINANNDIARVQVYMGTGTYDGVVIKGSWFQQVYGEEVLRISGNGLTAGTTYDYRAEITILLGDNLAS